MAQRTGADGLIAPRATLASAGVILALAALVLLAGCGGGGGEEEAQGQGGTAQEQRAEETSGSRVAADPDSTESSPGRGKEAPGGQAASEATGGEGKHGTPITLPKGAPEKGPTPAELAQTTMANILLTSPVLEPSSSSEERLPATYTCDGKNKSPPLQWQGVPEGTEELVIIALNLEPVNEAFFFDWALAGLDPSSQSLRAGEIPRGAILGKNSFGHNRYELCPPQGKSETFIFSLYALPKRLSPQKGFDPTALRKEILAQNGSVGLMAASYGR
jgi:phosphatidylethanolamine-binding protein (PEBP) family uncharacterized protein